MRVGISLSGGLLILIAILSFLLFVSNAYAADDGLPDGCHIATAAEVAAGAPAGRPVCPADTASGITNEVGQAKAYLNSLPKNALSSCAPPNEENIRKLNNTFAICAARFLKAYTSSVGGVVITSAFRDGAPGSAPNGKQSANQCAGGASGSQHQRGLAMDLYPQNGDFQKLWDFASQNPQFGVCFPYRGGDRPHMALAGANTGEAAKCAAQGVRSTCSGTSFDSSSEFSPAQSSTINPTSSITDALKKLLNPGGSQQQNEQLCTLSDGSTVPCSAIQNSGSQQPSQQQSSGVSQGISQSYQAPSYSGSSGSQQPVSNTLLSGTQNTGGSQEDTRSLLERLNEFAGLRRATTTATSVPVVVYVRREDANTVTSTSSTTATTSPIYDSAGYYQPPVSQETFVTPGFTSGNDTTFNQQGRSIWAALENMRQLLLRMLEYLRPFGRPNTESGSSDGYY